MKNHLKLESVMENRMKNYLKLEIARENRMKNHLKLEIVTKDRVKYHLKLRNKLGTKKKICHCLRIRQKRIQSRANEEAVELLEIKQRFYPEKKPNPAKKVERKQ